jgi:glucan-binding YG repeat protein
VVSYEANAADWFTDAEGETLTYHASCNGGGSLDIENTTGALTYIPAASDAGKTITIKVWANDGYNDSENVTVSLTVGAVPLDNMPPDITAGNETQQGEVTPASNDGLKAAVPYETAAADWFTDADDDTLIYYASCNGDGAFNISDTTGTLSYIPAASDADTTVTINVWANDGYHDSESVTVTLTAGAVPADVKNGMFFEDGGWYFYENDEKLYGFIEGEDGTRYFDPNDGGKAAVGWKEIEGAMRCFGDDGVMLNAGWYIVDGVERYFLESGIPAEGWTVVNGVKSRFGELGVPLTGLFEIDGVWYFLLERGIAAAPGFHFDGVYWRAVRPDGSLYPQGFYEIDGAWRYILNGSIVSPPGIYQTDIYYRYIMDGGLMASQGFYEIDGIWRYVLDGAIIAPVGWYDNLEGHRRYVADGGLLLPQGWHKIDGANRYILNGSIPASGWVAISGIRYLFDEYGKPVYR